jgi:hypothetical protein
MIFTLIALVAITIISIWLAKNSSWDSLEVIGIIGSIIGLIGLLVFSFIVFFFTAANYKKDIINREYKTNYTQEEVFYASDVIETVRELNRTRLEVNGNLLKDK